jgi:hypothetical protein
VKATLIVQFAAAARAAGLSGQVVLNTLKFPYAVMFEMVSAPAPLLVKVTAFEVLVLSTSCCEKLKLLGERLTEGLPAGATICDKEAVLGRNVASPL